MTTNAKGSALALDVRRAQEVVAGVLARLPGYVPGWTPAPGGPGWALLQIFGRDLQALIERVNQAPDKDQLAFLEQLGVALLSAQAARAPLVFTPRPNMGDARVPAGTRAGAAVPGRSDPLIFETEQDIALAAARLAEVVALWPGRDAYADHTSAVLGGRPFTLFTPLQPVRHEWYLAHDTHFALSGHAIVELQIELSAPASEPIPLAWEYWDGKVWRGFKDFVTADKHGESFDGTHGLTRSGVIRLAADCATTAQTKVLGLNAYWIRARVTGPLPPLPGRELATVDRLGIRTVIDHTADALQPDSAYAEAGQLDLSNTFFPFGAVPAAGAAFYFTSAEVLGKPGAAVDVTIATAAIPQQPDPKNWFETFTPALVWEYSHGAGWKPLNVATAQGKGDFQVNGILQFTVPGDVDAIPVNGRKAPWVRARLAGGGFGGRRKLSYRGPALPPATGEQTFTISMVEVVPPALKEFSLRYLYRSPQDQPQACLTYNDFQWQDFSAAVRWRGAGFAPFAVVADRTPALYLGFDAPLPADLVSLYLGVAELAGRAAGPLLRWEYWDGNDWLPLSVQDETNNFALPGMVAAVWPGVPAAPAVKAVKAAGSEVQLENAREAARFQPGDQLYLAKDGKGELVTVAGIAGDTLTVTLPLMADYDNATIGLAALPRFGTPRTWMRARLQSDGEPLGATLDSLHPNAVWASQLQTTANELLGSSTGQLDQVFFFRQAPVLAGQVLAVRELDGPRAAVELPMLLDELAAQGLSGADVRTVADRRTGQINEVWVRWQERPNLYLSGPGDRHYVIERSRGRVLFGDNRHGRIPPAGSDNLRVETYRSGGGTGGNVAAGAIKQMLSGVAAQGVFNPRAAEGGADGEPLARVYTRGPLVARHHRQALSVDDYEALAREASPAVAAARALPATHPSGRHAPGWVTIAIVPHSLEPQPQPSFTLRREVQAFLDARAPAGAAGRIVVAGPRYLPIGVAAVVVARDPRAAGPAFDGVLAALRAFLHPLTGGPGGGGWPFGRAVYLSDVAPIVESVPGVDYVSEIELLLDGTPRGDVVEVPPDRIVVAGAFKVTLR